VQILDGYLGPSFFQVGRAAHQLGSELHADRTRLAQLASGIQITNAGGLVGVFLAACGPSTRKEEHFRHLLQIVGKGKVDFILAFAGESTLPDIVNPDIIVLMKEIGIYQTRDIWAATMKALAHKRHLLEHTSLVLIYRDTENKLQSRGIGLHLPPHRAFGIMFEFCGNMACRPLPGDTQMKTQFEPGRTKEKVRLWCRRCDYQSPWIKVESVEWVHPLTNDSSVYWHHFPPTAQQITMFGGGKVKERDAAN
jgi:hypothetical protein